MFSVCGIRRTNFARDNFQTELEQHEIGSPVVELQPKGHQNARST